MAFQHGWATVPAADAYPTSLHVDFAKPIDGAVVLLEPISSRPDKVMATVNNVTDDGFDIVLYREDKTTTAVVWLAI